MLKAFITGVSCEALTADEAAFLAAERPCGLILFSRNCSSHDQIRALVASVKAAVGSDRLMVLIDQEGGRVQRLRPPLGRALPPAAAYARLRDAEPERGLAAAFLTARLVARDLLALGINTNCAPVLDVPAPGAHDIIGDRAYGSTPAAVAALGRAVAEGLMAGGVIPVMKHIPGHGRGNKDSHFDLPVVAADRATLSASDFAPFRDLADLPAAMTAHVVFTAVDPAHPASTSEAVTRDVIRGEIGFRGLLMSDDVSMQALSGTIAERTRAVIAAGSDVALHCNGSLDEMQAVAAEVPALAGESLARFERCLAVLGVNKPFDEPQAEAYLAEALAIGSQRTESV